MKKKYLAALLAVFLGGLGTHHFYLGNTMRGIIYLIFCWTGVPAIVALIEGIIYACQSEEEFNAKHH